MAGTGDHTRIDETQFMGGARNQHAFDFNAPDLAGPDVVQDPVHKFEELPPEPAPALQAKQGSISAGFFQPPGPTQV